MSLEEVISMEPVKEKLRNLRKYMPSQQDVIYEFGAFLADRLNLELDSQEFHTAAELALSDLQKGVDGFTGNPVQSRLVGLPFKSYFLLAAKVPQIAKAVCPEDFAKGVTFFYNRAIAKSYGGFFD